MRLTPLKRIVPLIPQTPSGKRTASPTPLVLFHQVRVAVTVHEWIVPVLQLDFATVRSRRPRGEEVRGEEVRGDKLDDKGANADDV